VAKAKTDPFDPQAFLVVVGTGKTVSKYRKNQIVFSQGDAADTIYYLQKGKIKVVVVSEQGKEAVVGLIEAGQFFGEGCMNGHRLRIATTMAMEPCLIATITKEAMLSALDHEPAVSHMEASPDPKQPGRRGSDRRLGRGAKPAPRTGLGCRVDGRVTSAHTPNSDSLRPRKSVWER
jgi:hypothetical protein